MKPWLLCYVSLVSGEGVDRDAIRIGGGETYPRTTKCAEMRSKILTTKHPLSMQK